jgi:hypothetical protein
MVGTGLILPVREGPIIVRSERLSRLIGPLAQGWTIVRFTQWLVGALVLFGSGVATVFLLSPGEADRLRKDNEAQARRIFELHRSIERLTGETRVAEVHVVDQVLAGQLVEGRPAPSDLTTIEFIELDREGHPLPSKRFQIADTVIFFDALVIKFTHELVAEGDELRGRSLALFRRIYGEHQQPAEGFLVDPAGDVPNVFRVHPDPGEEERALWAKFWDYAADPALAARKGVRVAQGEAVYMPMRKGEVWSLTLQNDGGLNLTRRRAGLGPSRASAATAPARP